ncbi:MAG TPA: hypothetical protein VJR06_05605 [Nitrososphaerales archaeon]|nr:hypothetical protein [Nitrososphaerales archaeon]
MRVIYLKPSRMSSTMEGCFTAAPGSGFFATATPVIPVISEAETRKVRVFSPKAATTPTAAIMAAPAVFAVNWSTELEVCTSALALASCSLPTTSGVSALSAGWKRVVNDPSTKATTSITARLNPTV